MAISYIGISPVEGSVLELPPLDAVVLDLNNCRKDKNLPLAKHAHLEILRNGLETNKSLGNFMVPMFVECGSMLDAQRAFVKLPQPNEHSWTSLIRGYVHFGEHEYALSLFEKMQQDFVAPSGYTFLAVLKACGHLKCAREGYSFHLDIVKHGFEEEPFVSDYVVDMYAKCGSLTEARRTFDVVANQDVNLWNVLLVRFVEFGHNEEALSCLAEMQQKGVSPNDVAFVCSLKACTALGHVHRGQRMHIQIVEKGYEEDIFVGNTLVDFYANSGLLVEAQEVFDGLSIRDVVTWTALIAGYAEWGFGEEALNCLEAMVLEGLVPNFVTYFSSLKACASIGAIEKGQFLHVATTKEGFEQDYLVSSTLIDFYLKCGLLIEARAVLDALPARNVVMWTAMMTGYVEHGLATEALNCWTQMQVEGIYADAATFVCILKVCGSLRLIELGSQLHLEVVTEGYELNSFVGSTLVDMYARCGLLIEAKAALEEMPVKCVVSWTALMDGYMDHCFATEALACHSEMQSEGLSPNAHTFVCFLKGSMAIESFCEGKTLHANIIKHGFEKDLFVACTLIDMYSNWSCLEDAQAVFDALPARDSVVWNSIVVGCAECKDMKQALSYLRQMQTEGICPSTMTWNALLVGFSDHEEVADCFEFYMKMLDQAIFPDVFTFVSILKACGSSAALEMGQRIHAQVDSLGISNIGEADEVIIGTGLVDMYSKCGRMKDAQLVFDRMSKKDLMVWITLFAGYARHGEYDHMLGLLMVLGNEGLKPDEFIAFSVLTAYSHTGQVVEGIKFFEGLSENYGICPNSVHENCAIDLLSRAGQVVEAVRMLKEMPFQPDIIAWNTVLAACQSYAEIDISKDAFEHVTYSDENGGSALILMSNIYADSDGWEEPTWLDQSR